MPKTYGYYVADNNTWKDHRQATGEVKGQTRSAESHSERVAWKGFGNRASTVYLLEQDAFPCDKCHTFFKGESNTHAIIIKAWKDSTGDGAGYTLTNAGKFPQYIYYYKGAATFTDDTSKAPTGFPKHPDPAKLTEPRWGS